MLFIAAPSSVYGQLASERIDGIYRICSYGSYLTVPAPGAVAREYRVGFAQNCPAVPPGVDPSSPAPPTAQLSSETLRDGTRFCSYQQAGGQWTIPIEASRYCPLSAGMTMRRDEARSRVPPPRDRN